MKSHPVKSKLIEWCNKETWYQGAANDESKIKMVHQFINQQGELAKIHHGSMHLSKQRKVNKAPENLLIILWLLRYAIFDEESHFTFKKFLSPEALQHELGTPDPIMYDPQWIKSFILNPIHDFTFNYIPNDKTKIGQKIIQYFVKNDSQKKRLRESITHTLLQTFINIMLKHGSEPGFTRRSGTANANDFIEFLKANIKGNQQQHPYHICTDLYQLFFMAFPKFVERHVEIHWKRIFCNFIKKEDIKKNWKKNTTIDNFKLCLPYLNNKGKWETKTIEDFFILIRKGRVTLETLIGEVNSNDSDVEIVEEATDTTKKRKSATDESPSTATPTNPSHKRKTKTDNFVESMAALASHIDVYVNKLKSDDYNKNDIMLGLQSIKKDIEHAAEKLIPNSAKKAKIEVVVDDDNATAEKKKKLNKKT